MIVIMVIVIVFFVCISSGVYRMTHYSSILYRDQRRTNHVSDEAAVGSLLGELFLGGRFPSP